MDTGKDKTLIGKKDSTSSYGTTVHNYTGSFTSNSTNFYNTYTQEYSSWTGFSCSSLADSSVNGDYTHDMYLYGTTGANNSKKFAIAYSDSAYFTLSAVKTLKVYTSTTPLIPIRRYVMETTMPPHSSLAVTTA